jgi:outer membrane protein OmpA-like peptidoglycan-associated protein
MLWFLKLSNSNFSIEGPDSDGSNEYNQGLSDDRAAAVKEALVQKNYQC